mgnify:CR=1 FL=1
MGARRGSENHAARPPPVKDTSPRKAYGKVEVAEEVSLLATLHTLGPGWESPWPLPMEKLGQGYGYTLYRSHIQKGEQLEKLQLTQTADRASVFIEEQPALTLYDKQLEKEYALDMPINGGLQLDILTENMGRVNYGHHMADQRKALLGKCW